MKPQDYLRDIDFTKPPKLNFVKRLTNQTGIIQHTKYAVPDRNLGYSVDDNSRALLMAVLYYKLFGQEEVLDLAVNYLSFVHHAKTKDNFFYNFLSFDNKFKDKAKTEDGFGRCLWALGYTVFAQPRRDLNLGAENLVNEIKDNILKLSSPRAKAYSLAGIYYFYESTQKKDWLEKLVVLADQLVGLYQKTSRGEWKWFENYLTYSNAIFPYSLALAYGASGNEIYLKTAQDSLAFLDKESRLNDGTPAPIGSNGWYTKGKKKALYDQQPLDAAAMVLAFLALYKVSFAKNYLEKALEWFSWYFGNNIAKKEVYDSVTGGCFDAVNPEGVNLNQGAESIVTFLIAYLAFSDIELKLGK